MILVLHNTKPLKVLPAVVTDAESIAKLALDHLQSLGLRHFAFCGFDAMSWSNERKAQFERLVTASGFDFFLYKQPGIRMVTDWNDERHSMERWIRSLPKPIGILACNDDRGQHVLEACKAAGMAVPDEVAVIGVDNDAILCELCEPPLSSIALNTEEAGYMSARLLHSLMNGDRMRGQEIIVSGTHIVKRQSTDVLSVDNADVANAIRFLRQNIKNKIRIDSIVAQTHLSRRSLEMQFRRLLRRTIYKEVCHARIELMMQMLVETNVSISEITASLSFTDVAHASRFFKRESGMSMKQFRESKQSILRTHGLHKR
jgi:LacI family transcriptional regulator